jgi:hypothetical protein
MKKPQVGDQGYQALEQGPNEKASPSADERASCDIATKKEVNSGGPSRLIKDGEIKRSDTTPKKFYSKPTLINYGTARELAKRFGSRLKWPDLFK